MNLMVEFKYLSWDDVMDLTIKVSESIVKDNYKPNIVVGVARGGVVIAKIIEDILGIGNMTSIEVKLYRGINDRGEEARIAQPLPVSVKGLRILLVDDVSDTGTTLSVAYNYLKEQGAIEIRTATLMIKPWTRFRPNYYAGEATAWIIFPWEIGETIRELGSRFDAALGEARNNSIVTRIRNLVHNTPTNTK